MRHVTPRAHPKIRVSQPRSLHFFVQPQISYLVANSAYRSRDSWLHLLFGSAPPSLDCYNLVHATPR